MVHCSLAPHSSPGSWKHLQPASHHSPFFSGPLHRRGGRSLNLGIKFHLLSLLKMYLEGKRQYFMCSFCVFTRGPCYLLPLDRFWGEQSRQPPCSFAFLRQSTDREHGTYLESYMNLFSFLFCFYRLDLFCFYVLLLRQQKHLSLESERMPLFYLLTPPKV